MRFRGTTIRRKIVALLLIPLVSLTAIWVFAATITSRAVFGRPDAQRIANNVVYPAEDVLSGIQQERKVALLYIANSRDSQARIAYDKQQHATDSAIAKLRTQSGTAHIQDLNSRARGYLADFLTGLGNLSSLRKQVDNQQITRESTYDGYDTFQAPAFALCDSLYLIDNADLEARFAKLGVEPLSPEFTPEALGAMASGRTAPLKSFLLDQSGIAGVGNIYADEALYRARLHPLSPAGSMKPEHWLALRDGVVAALEVGIDSGGSTIDDYRDGRGEKGRMQERFLVHTREGQPCPGDDCDGVVERIVVSGRSTYFCPSCQVKLRRKPKRRVKPRRSSG